MIEFLDASRVYHRRGAAATHALRGVTLSVARGEFVAVIGRSGSGKSTLLHLAAALDLPSGGIVRIDGRATSEMSETQRTTLRRHRVGLVFQFFNLLPTLPIEWNVAMPLLLDGRRLGTVRPRVHELLDRIGLRSRAGDYPDQLSGGEMQRVAIARAVLVEPSILLADEPTGNLDTATSESIMGFLRTTAHESGRTTLLVTHDMAVAAQADRVVTLRDGRVESGQG
ncbi:MAG: ABC transporter ATP-binding protein [Planctomycetia bacterium]|nr:MAG: ABC transporter ATP-binding protein [Planctomycetia bacterium]